MEELAAYDPSWPLLFEQEATQLKQLFLPQSVAVEHVGSTAVPGMVARPVIDIFVGLFPLLPLAQYEQLFLYTDYRQCPAEKAGRYSFYRPALQIAGYSLHLLPMAGFYMQSELLLRDFLRTHPKAVMQACKIKQAAFAQCCTDPGTYAKAKAALHAQLLGTAAPPHRAPPCPGGEPAVKQKPNTVFFPPVTRTS